MALLGWLLQADLPQVLFIFITVLLIILITRRVLDDLSAPPGPWGVPIFGYQPFLDMANLSDQLKKLSEKYGPVFSFRAGQRLTVVLSDFDSVKDTFIRKADIFSARRGEGFSIDGWIVNYKGMSHTEGEVWKAQRRFLLSTLRDFGFAKLSLEGIVHEETEALRTFLAESNGQPINVSQILSKVASNILCHLTFGRRYEYDNKNLERLLALSEQFVKNFGLFHYMDNIPFIRFLPLSWMGYGELIEFKTEFTRFVKDQVAEHEQTYDPNHLRDLVDVYLQRIYETDKLPEDQRKNSIYTRGQMITNSRLLFMAGAEGVATTTQWAMKLLLLNPKVQEKIQEELDRVVGRARLPSLTDRPNLSYCEATLQEVLRYSSLQSVNLSHCNTEETEVNGYKIPKRTDFIANFRQIHFDPKHWKNPDVFDPSRFLDRNGKVSKPEYFIPFSTGPRICPGESLARMELFTFFASILQNFKLLPPKGEKVSILTTEGVVKKLAPFQIRFVLRE